MEETYNSGSRGPADGKRASGSFWAELKNFDLYQKARMMLVFLSQHIPRVSSLFI